MFLHIDQIEAFIIEFNSNYGVYWIPPASIV